MGDPKDLLDAKILALSDSDFLRFRGFIKGGTLIAGSLGSGKSSTSAKVLASAFLNAGMGGLVTTVKTNETQLWVECAKQAGREKDLVAQDKEGGKSGLPKKSSRRKNASSL